MYAQPDYPAAMASLQSMDAEQLKEILNNDVKFDDFMKELPQLKSLDNEKVVGRLRNYITGLVLYCRTCCWPATSPWLSTTCPRSPCSGRVRRGWWRSRGRPLPSVLD